VEYYNQLKNSFKGQGERVDVYVGINMQIGENKFVKLTNLFSEFSKAENQV
jgi:hypothetical protein